MKPTLLFTSGDPGGVGTEVAWAAVRAPKVLRVCRPVLVGPRAAFKRAGWRPGGVLLLETGGDSNARRPTAKGGRASYDSFLFALELCRRKAAAGMVTGPVSKEAWRLAGVRHPDQTAVLREETGSAHVGMMLLGRGLRAVLATRHLALKRACAAAGRAAIEEAASLASDALSEKFGLRRPHLALCALNPHAGEGGLIGDEERRVLGPTAARLRRRGIRIDGPLPADAAWAAHGAGRFDALVALYHDQALVPLKLWAGYAVVNWTIGVPILRMAPGHGTAFNIAGRGKADPSGMIEAALLAAKLARGS